MRLAPVVPHGPSSSTAAGRGSPARLVRHPRLVNLIGREWVADWDPGKTMEVSVRRPELAHGVLSKQGGDVGIGTMLPEARPESTKCRR
jgi:hypothetical protein